MSSPKPESGIDFQELNYQFCKSASKQFLPLLSAFQDELASKVNKP